MTPGEGEADADFDQFEQLERGLAGLTFPLFHAVGSSSRIIGWSGDAEQLTGVEIGDPLWVGPTSNPPGLNVHTSLRIDNMAEERIALVVVPIHPLKEGEPFDIDLPLEETRSRVASATRTRSATLAIDGVPEPWTLVEGDGAWAAARHHGELTITVVGRGFDFADTQLERVPDPLALDRPKRPEARDAKGVIEVWSAESDEGR